MKTRHANGALTLGEFIKGMYDACARSEALGIILLAMKARRITHPAGRAKTNGDRR